MGFFSDMSEDSFTENEQNVIDGEVAPEAEDAGEDGEFEDEFAPEPEEVFADDDFRDVAGDRANGTNESQIEESSDKDTSKEDLDDYEQIVPASFKDKDVSEDSCYEQESKEATVVGSSTVIEGSISSDKLVLVSGRVRGGITAGKVSVNEGGRVEGDVKADEIFLRGGVVTGAVDGKSVSILAGKIQTEVISSSGSFFVYEDAVVVGNISSGDTEIYGKVKGNISSTGVVVLFPTAVVKGDISARDAHFVDGSKFQGVVEKTGEIDDSEFE